MDVKIKELKTAPTRSRILITGGFGFIGSQLVRLLRGYDVTVLDNMLSGMPLTTAPFICGDIRDRKLINETIPQYDIIVHMAAIVGEPACVLNPVVSTDINAGGTLNIAEALNKNQRVIFMSTSSVYGTLQHVAHEGCSLAPDNNYALQKASGEKYIHYSGADYIILRPVTAFGVTDRIRMDLLVNNFIFQALTQRKIEIFEPELPRPSIHVFDIARIIKYAIDGHLAWNEAYNVGNPELNLTKYELASKISELTDAEIITIEGKALDTRNYVVEFEKLLESGFIFTERSLQRGIEQIEANMFRIKKNPLDYQTTELFRRFLAKDRKDVYNS